VPAPLTIDQLILKGTHNSYSCRGKDAPCMNHPPEKQIDDFGVWHLELDFSLVREKGGPVAVVGHDRPGEAACWGYYLADFVHRISAARSLAFRPVFVCLDVKAWKRCLLTPWRQPPDAGYSFDEKWQCGVAALAEASGERFLNLEAFLKQRDYVWPTMDELTGKIVLYQPNKRTQDGRLVGLSGTHADHCVERWQVERAIASGRPFERNQTLPSESYRALRLDQYQADWTFEYGVPPNPIIVDAQAAPTTRVDDAEGQRWRCGHEVSHGELVGEHGTYRFPYRSLERAIERARGITALTGSKADPRRAGYGWTVLVHGTKSSSSETSIDIPLSVIWPTKDS
jgi:hypothetical protein